MACLHVHTGLKMRFKLRFTELVDFLDEMANVAKKKVDNISLSSYRLRNMQIKIEQLKIPESVILGKVNSISLESRVGITGKRKGVTDRLTKGRSECGGNFGKMPFIPERTLAIHRRHQVDLSTKTKRLLDTVTLRY
jgi:hypothetical protein